VTFDDHHTLILAIFVLFLGRGVNRRIHWLREYGIPEPVTGGLIASFVLTLLVLATGVQIKFELAARDMLLIVFFTTVGLSANLSLLAKGGVMLVVLTIVAVLNLVVQNGVGVGLATLMGFPPAAGLLGGSAALSGGHGTVLAWGPIIGAKFDVATASAMGAAAATFGLIAGGLLGGPLGHRLVTRHRLSAKDAEELTVGVSYEDENKPKLDANGLLATVLVIAIAIAVSDELNDLLEAVHFTLPKFVTALFCGMVLSNTVPRLFPRLGWPTGSAPLALVAEVTLGLFLSMSLMTLNLASLAGVALPLMVILTAQVAVAWLLISRVVFRRLLRTSHGRDTDRHRHHDVDDQEIRGLAPVVPGGAAGRRILRRHLQCDRPSDLRQAPRGVEAPSGRTSFRFVFTQQVVRFLYANHSLPLKMRYSRRRWSGNP